MNVDTALDRLILKHAQQIIRRELPAMGPLTSQQAHDTLDFLDTIIGILENS